MEWLSNYAFTWTNMHTVIVFVLATYFTIWYGIRLLWKLQEEINMLSQMEGLRYTAFMTQLQRHEDKLENIGLFIRDNIKVVDKKMQKEEITK